MLWGLKGQILLICIDKQTSYLPTSSFLLVYLFLLLLLDTQIQEAPSYPISLVFLRQCLCGYLSASAP